MLVEWNTYYYSRPEIDIDLMAAEFQFQNQYVKIDVRNPRTHISREKALYTDYEISVLTNNIAFSSSDSVVRRRYSDFQWLRTRLLSQYGIEKHLPELPPKRLFGRFKRPFLKHRQKGLQRFLVKITNEPTYLSDITVHLFLQSTFSVKEIDNKLNGTDSGGELLEVLQSPSTSRGRGLSRSSSHVDGVDDINFEHDSGFSYSTTSSINDGMAPHTPSHKPITNGHCVSSTIDLDKTYSPSRKLHTKFESEKNHYDTHDDHSTVHSSTDDEFFHSHDYDADDEIEGPSILKDIEENNNRNYFESSDDDGDLFCFCKDSQGAIYSLDRAFEIIKMRPKLTDRLYSQDDSDDCFRESEYDVIDTEDDLDITEIVDDDTYPKATIPIIKIRSNSYSEGGVNTKVLTRSINKLKTGKVKSLPNIRFPIRNKKVCATVKRSLTYHGVYDMRSSKLKEVNEQEELALFSDKETNSTFNKFFLSPSQKFHKSESEGQQLTSDADYLTTVHKHMYNGNDSHADTIDTQAEDIAPSKFYDFFRRRKKRSSNVQLMSFRRMSGSYEEQKGRFLVSTVLTPQTLTSDNTTLNNVNTKENKVSDDGMTPLAKDMNSELCDDILSNDTTDGTINLEDVSGTQRKQPCVITDQQEKTETMFVKPDTEYVTSNEKLTEKPCNKITHICVALCRNECVLSSSYRISSEEMMLTEHAATPLQTTSNTVTRKDAITSLLKTYDVIVA